MMYGWGAPPYPRQKGLGPLCTPPEAELGGSQGYPKPRQETLGFPAPSLAKLSFSEQLGTRNGDFAWCIPSLPGRHLPDPVVFRVEVQTLDAPSGPAHQQ